MSGLTQSPMLAPLKKLRRDFLRPAYWREQDRIARSLVSLDDAKRSQSVDSLAQRFIVSKASELKDRRLAQLLGDVTLGHWTIDGSSLELLCGLARTRKPEAIIEFGSGVSTVCFASIMADIHGDASARVFSIEQDLEQVGVTRRRLEAAGVEAVVKIVHAPVTGQTIEGHEVSCYALNDDLLTDLLGGLRPEFVLVDGPSGGSGVRFGTLPLVKNVVAPNAVFHLHDGFRSEEISVARRWETLPYLKVDGVRPVGHGLIAGHFEIPAG